MIALCLHANWISKWPIWYSPITFHFQNNYSLCSISFAIAFEMHLCVTTLLLRKKEVGKMDFFRFLWKWWFFYFFRIEKSLERKKKAQTFQEMEVQAKPHFFFLRGQTYNTQHKTRNEKSFSTKPRMQRFFDSVDFQCTKLFKNGHTFVSLLCTTYIWDDNLTTFIYAHRIELFNTLIK